MTDMHADAYANSTGAIFPRLGEVGSTQSAHHAPNASIALRELKILLQHCDPVI